jgi:hypothetical protein
MLTKKSSGYLKQINNGESGGRSVN